MGEPGEYPVRLFLITSGDVLADIVCRRLYDRADAEIVGVARTSLAVRAQLGLVRKAAASHSLYYAAYMAAEVALPRYLCRNRPPSILKWACGSEIPLIHTTNVNESKTIDFIKDCESDLVLSVRPGVIFRSKLIAHVPRILNLHCTMLPNYRGIGGVMQALAHGESELGATLHVVDSGPIVAQCSVSAGKETSVFAETLRLYIKASDLIDEVIGSFHAERPARMSPPGSYFSWPGASTLRSLRTHGRSMLKIGDVLGARRIPE